MATTPIIEPEISLDTRMRMFRMQVEIRESEQRAYDLFLQNLVKGTSHLSLGQEAVAAGCAAAMDPGDLTFCTYRGHAHTLARGTPIEKVLGERSEEHTSELQSRLHLVCRLLLEKKKKKKKNPLISTTNNQQILK